MAEWMYVVLSLLFIPLLILTIVVHTRVKSIYKKYKKINSKSGITTRECTRKMLDAEGLTDVEIKESTGGTLSDYYDPKAKSVHLARDGMDSTSIATIAVAAHEVGHAYQHADKSYTLMRLRTALHPIVMFANRMSIPMFIIGLLLLIFSAIAHIGVIVLWISVVLYFATTLLSLVTLPIEINASKRALETISKHGMLAPEEMPAAKELLTAAAWTYIAGLVTSLYYFFRFLLQIVFITRDK